MDSRGRSSVRGSAGPPATESTRSRVLAEAHGREEIDTIRAIAPLLDVETEARLLEEAESVDFDGVTTPPGAEKLLQRFLPEAGRL